MGVLRLYKNCRRKNVKFLGLCKTLLMGLGQDQQQHPAGRELAGGGSVAVAVGVSDM